MSEKIFRLFLSLIIVVGLVAVEQPRTVGAAPPGNDDFVNAEVIGSLPFNVAADITEATFESGEPHECVFSPYETVWYAFTPAVDMYIRMSAEASAIDSNVTMYRSDGPGFGGLTFWACAQTSSLAPVIPVDAGMTYYFQVGSLVDGVVQLDLEEVPPPANDFFSDAVTIGSLPFNDIVDVGAATVETDEPQQCAGTYKTVWYSFTPSETMLVKADADGSTWSANINIYRAEGPGFAGLSSITCTRFFSGVFQVEAGVTYILQAGVQDPLPAVLNINLRQVFPPVNDDFAAALVLDTVPPNLSVDLSGASVEPDEPTGCNSSERSAWYSFTPSETISLRIDTLNNNLFTNVHVYSSNGPGFAGLSLLGCVFSGGSNGFTLQAGQPYYLQIIGDAGLVQANLSQAVPPPNDAIATPVNVTALPFSDSIEIIDASIEPDEWFTCHFMPKTVWYAFTPAETTRLRVDTAGSSVYGNISIYRQNGSGFSGLEFVACSGPFNPLAFDVEAGQTYFFQVGAAFGEVGTVQMNLADLASIRGRITSATSGDPLPGDSDPFAAAYLYRVCGESCLEFVNAKQVDTEGRFSFDVNIGGAPLPFAEYRIFATANSYANQEFGPFTFSGTNLDVGDLPLQPPAQIRGRVVDSSTGDPLPGASVTLRRCDAGGCFEYINSISTDANGLFRFAEHFGSPLAPGDYEIEVSASQRVTVRQQVTLAEGQDLDVGDVALQLIPFLGSISGRLLDDLTGLPIAAEFASTVQLFQCADGGGCTFVNVMSLGADGRFHFETDFSGNRLPAGEYQILAQADQYYLMDSGHFTVGENVNYDTGDIRLTSFPVRFSELQDCGVIPAAGGECEFSVRVTNGTDHSLTGKTWSMANVYLPDSFIQNSNFQVKDAQDLGLGVGRSKVFRFRLKVPENRSTTAGSVCTFVFVGEGSQALFNTIGSRSLFCITREGSGFAIVSRSEVQSSGQEVSMQAVSVSEVEPNNSCQAAQDMGVSSDSITIDGLLDSASSDIDFFRFTGTPGARITIDHEGQATGKGTLSDPLLGFYGSNCNLIDVNDDSGSLNSHLEIIVPVDGVFILAATAYPDFAFDGGEGNGTYQLTVAPETFIGSISGVIVDGITGQPLSGISDPYTYVWLTRCDMFGCTQVNDTNADEDGRFHFETDYFGMPLPTGQYYIMAAAAQYQTGSTATFTVSSDEHYDIGNVPLQSYPVRFSDIEPCSVPTEGGICEFRVRVTNGLATRLNGKVWNIINGFELGSFANYTNFQVDTVRDISLDPGRSTLLRFRFQVRGAVQDGAVVCVAAYAGQNPDAFYNTVGEQFIFCFEKGSDGFTLLSPAEMYDHIQLQPAQEVAPLASPLHHK